MTEVTDSIPEDDAKKLQSGKKENKPSSNPRKTDSQAKRAPSSGQQEQRDSTVQRGSAD